MTPEIDPKLVAELAKLTGYLLWISIGSILSFAGLAIKITWSVSKYDSESKDLRKDINGFGGRVKSIEENNHTIDKRVSILEHRVRE